ncbi:glycosyltransferase family 39 protein [Bradyrhizobium jicamae]|uniref:glycosyltransferase family 39 protein n=1 Tax=Bradyrhizobium jicamae TaxID=280332 RepID=UPI001BA8A9E5|nr:glycosyltransferase family 39 protein [Bradyrhizobium jicamae]MBR0756866.1 glycosyltransferase family 39 protein [Bradyrhizobium jicamae]
MTSRALRLPARTLLVLCIVTLGALTVLRGVFAAGIDLRVDEAYYWSWSREHVISYLDHPPVIAWCIRATTALFGDDNFGVRFTGLAAMLIMQLVQADIVRRLVGDLRYVVLVMLLPEASLDYGLGMAKITPDVAVIPCEMAMVWSLVRLWQSDDLRWWLPAGLFGGFALMSKYTAILLLPAVLAFAFVPAWRGRQLASPWLWAAACLVLIVISPLLYWNALHDWASFRFQLDRPPQVSGWSPRFLADFLGQQFLMVGILLLPIALIGTVMLAVRGYRARDPVPILLSTSLLFPLGFFLEHGTDTRVGDSWLLFAWPFGILCAVINLKQWRKQSAALLPRIGPAVMVAAVASGVAAVVTVQLYYLVGTQNYLTNDDPIGKEAGFAAVVREAEVKRRAIGANWFATTDYRMSAMLRWHLRDQVPVVQINERARYIGFNDMKLDGPIGLYVAPKEKPHRELWDRTSAVLKPVGEADLSWRGFRYDVYSLQELTGWKPGLSPPPGDAFYVARPN